MFVELSSRFKRDQRSVFKRPSLAAASPVEADGDAEGCSHGLVQVWVPLCCRITHVKPTAHSQG